MINSLKSCTDRTNKCSTTDVLSVGFSYWKGDKEFWASNWEETCQCSECVGIVTVSNLSLPQAGVHVHLQMYAFVNEDNRFCISC